MTDIHVTPAGKKGWAVKRGGTTLSTHTLKRDAVSRARAVVGKGGKVHIVARSAQPGRFVNLSSAAGRAVLPSQARTAVRAVVRSKGQVTIPREIREALHVSEGDDVAFTVTSEGSVVLTGMRSIPADQAWFWSAEWQEGEREASEQIERGETTFYPSTDDFLASLD